MLRLLVVLCIAVRCARDALRSGTGAQDREDTWKKCRGNDPDVRLPACTTLIDGGQETPAELASAYYARGSAYRQKSLFALALDDFNAAIKANPALTDAYGDRGITLTILGRFADAIPDYTRVIEAYPQARLCALQPRDLLRADRSRRSRASTTSRRRSRSSRGPSTDSSAAARSISARISSTRRSPITSRRW